MKKVVKKSSKRDEDILARAFDHCAWCQSKIDEGGEVFGFGARLKPGVDLSEIQGQIIPIYLFKIDKTVPAMVPPGDSPAKQDGNDLYFLVCSEECAIVMKRVIDKELDMIEEMLKKKSEK